MPEREDGLLHSRQTKLNRLRERGLDPYPPRFRRSATYPSRILTLGGGPALFRGLRGRRPRCGLATQAASSCPTVGRALA